VLFRSQLVKQWKSLSVDELESLLNDEHNNLSPHVPDVPTLTIPLAAQRLHCHEGTIRNLIRRGLLRRIPLGTRICRVSVKELDALAEKGVDRVR
jgi:excisionase family DNA binding protein